MGHEETEANPLAATDFTDATGTGLCCFSFVGVRKADRFGSADELSICCPPRARNLPPLRASLNFSSG